MATTPVHIASATGIAQDYVRLKSRKYRIVLLALCTLLLVVFVVSLGLGGITISPVQVLGILLDRLGLSSGIAYADQQAMVLMAIRLPRILLAMLVGAGLAVSGAIMQGLFRNPLADPGLIGVSSGAALAAVLMIVFGTTILGTASTIWQLWAIPLAAFLGSLAAIYLVYTLATWKGQTSVATMLLAGIALNALTAAGTGLMLMIADDAQLRDITFWTLGSVGGATWKSLAIIAPLVLIGIGIAIKLAASLNAMMLGEADATHLGIKVQYVKGLVVWITGLTVGATVAVTGIIGFVGLVVPHLLRLATGPDNRLLVPGSALLGASLLLAADLLARTIIAPAELPIGIVTSLLGAPFFLWLLLKYRDEAGTNFA
ncbi:MAG: iron ABC transporter permease [Bacteroidota bacterium]